MAKLFEQYLIEEIEITDTRAGKLAEAIETIHRALCCLDEANLFKVHAVGLNGLLRDYIRIEQVRDVMPQFKLGGTNG